MWTTLLAMGVVVSLEPFRIGMTVVMLNRPRPMRQLLACLCGGYAMGMGVGLAVLFVLRHTLPVGANFNLPKVQIVIGLLALLVAAVLATNIPLLQFQRGTLAGAAVGGVERPAPSAVVILSARARNLMQGSSLWVAGVVGLGMALPSIDYTAAFAVILASDAAPAVQAGALLMFNVVAFALVEIPLVSYLAAPDKTRALMGALHDWIRSRRRRDVAVLLAAVGCFMLGVGVAGL